MSDSEEQALVLEALWVLHPRPNELVDPVTRLAARPLGSPHHELEEPNGEGVRRNAIFFLGAIGPTAASAAPTLASLLEERGARDALVKIGAPAIPLLAAALSDPHDPCRVHAALTLGRMGRTHPEALARLDATRLSNLTPDLCIALLLARHTADPQRDIVPDLLAAIEALADSDSPLLSFGPALLLETRVGLDVTEELDRAISSIGLESRGSVLRLIEALESHDERLQHFSFKILAAIARHDPGALSTILGRLRDGTPQQRKDAARVLRYAEAEAAEVARALFDSLRDDEFLAVRETALGSLRALGRRAESIAPEFAGFVEDRLGTPTHPPLSLDRDVLRFVEDRLGTPTHPPLSLDRDVLLAAAIAICPADSRTCKRALSENRALDLLTELLRHDSVPNQIESLLAHRDLRIRTLTARLLIRAGTPPEPLIPALRQALRDDWHWDGSSLGVSNPPYRNLVRQDAARAIAAIGPAAHIAKPQLAACLDYPDRVLRILAAEALWKACGEKHLNVLEAAFLNRDYSLPSVFGVPTASWVEEAIRVLREMGPEAAATAPALRRSLDNPIGRAYREDIEELLAVFEGDSGN